MLRSWLFILLHNFRDNSISFQIQIYLRRPLQPILFISKAEVENWQYFEPKVLFSTFLAIQQGHASFSFNTCRETLQTWHRSTETIDQAGSSKRRGCGAPAVFPAHSTLHSTRLPVCPHLSTGPGGHTDTATQDSNRFWNGSYSHVRNVHSTPKMSLVRI